MSEAEAKPNRSRPRPQIEFFRSWCKKCGICAAFCPTHVLGQDHDGSPYVADAEKCTGCLLCEMRCPDFAIKVTRKPQRADEIDAVEGEEHEPQTVA